MEAIRIDEYTGEERTVTTEEAAQEGYSIMKLYYKNWRQNVRLKALRKRLEEGLPIRINHLIWRRVWR